MTVQNIPIQNVFYLLCYAWGMADMRNKVRVGVDNSQSMGNLLAHVLVSAIEELLRRGLCQEYNESEHIVEGIKGRLNVASTLKLGRLRQGKTICHYDELSSNTLTNQIIYSTLIEIMRLEDLERKNKERIAKVIHKFPQTRRIHITEQSFHSVRLHRNNRYYQFAINVCQLLFNSMLPDESKQGMKEFVNIMDDERQMNLIFERFLLNFCKQECKETYPVVGRSHIHFQLTPTAMTFVRGTDEALELLPIMETDVTLYNPQTGRKTILDAKYYHETLVSKYGNKRKIRREHLSQIITYVMNQEDDNIPHTKDTAGILIYPTTDKDIDVSYNYKNTNHTIRVCTVNLNQDWQLIEKRLKEIINASTNCQNGNTLKAAKN